VVKHISDRVAVMYLGKIIEIAATDDLFNNAMHPYTRALVKAIPVADPTIKAAAAVLKGEVPSPIDPPSGCAFHPRCPEAMDICREVVPERRLKENGHQVACHLYPQVK